jgi:hypothetical protein
VYYDDFIEENRVLKDQLEGQRLRFTDILGEVALPPSLEAIINGESLNHPPVVDRGPTQAPDGAGTPNLGHDEAMTR